MQRFLFASKIQEKWAKTTPYKQIKTKILNSFSLCFFILLKYMYHFKNKREKKNNFIFFLHKDKSKKTELPSIRSRNNIFFPFHFLFLPFFMPSVVNYLCINLLSANDCWKHGNVVCIFGQLIFFCCYFGWCCCCCCCYCKWMSSR